MNLLSLCAVQLTDLLSEHRQAGSISQSDKLGVKLQAEIYSVLKQWAGFLEVRQINSSSTVCLFAKSNSREVDVKL